MPKNIKALKELRATLLWAYANNALNMYHWGRRPLEYVQVIDPQPGDCGTALCAAGWSVVNAGWKIHWVLRETTATRCYKTGTTYEIEEVAIKELGLTYREANCLFNTENPGSQDDIEQSEVIQTLDGLIVLAELYPDRMDVEDAFDTLHSRKMLIDLARDPASL